MTLLNLLLTLLELQVSAATLVLLTWGWKLELGSSCSKVCRVTPKASLDSKRNENIWGVPKVSVAQNCESLYKMEIAGQMRHLHIMAPFLEL